MAFRDRLYSWGLFPDRQQPERAGEGSKAVSAPPRGGTAEAVIEAASAHPATTTNGNGAHPETKQGISFIGDQRTIIRLIGGLPIDYDGFDVRTVRGRTAYIAAALAYICISYRARKLMEAPLFVAEEQKTGRDKWIKPHDADKILRKPNPDMGMKRVIEAIEVFLLTTGRVLLVKNQNRMGQTESMYAFSGDEFVVEPDERKTRLYGKFTINGSGNVYKPEQVIFLQYFHPTDPWSGLAPLDAALTSLNIGQTLQHRVKHMVKNAFAAGALYILDKDAGRLNDKEFERAKEELNTVTQGVNTGKAAVVEGGGRIEKGYTLGDYQLGELWREIEAQVCGCFNIPPSLVGTVVGLENSPWSHMPTAKQMFYDECIIPEWDFIADAFTEQLLPEFDDKPNRYIRFDTTRVRALQKDLAQQALVASAVSRFTSVDERRLMIGMDPATPDQGEGGEKIPELNAPAMPAFGLSAADDEEETEEADDEEETEEEKARWPRKLRTKASRQHRYAIWDALASSAADVIALAAASSLENDRINIVRIMEGSKTAGDVSEQKDAQRRAIRAAEREAEEYLRTTSQTYWRNSVAPHIQAAAERAGALAAIDLGLDAYLLNEDLLRYAERESGWLVKEVSKTTRESIGRAVSDGIAAGEDSRGIANRLRDLPAFNRERAMLVGRTESTRVTNGAPRDALSDFGRRTKQKFVKTWFAVLDSRTRDEHWDLNGEQVPIDQPFSDGSMAPDEPNCRCTLLYGAVEDVQSSRTSRGRMNILAKAIDALAAANQRAVNLKVNVQRKHKHRSIKVDKIERDPSTGRITGVNLLEDGIK